MGRARVKILVARKLVLAPIISRPESSLTLACERRRICEKRQPEIRLRSQATLTRDTQDFAHTGKFATQANGMPVFLYGIYKVFFFTEINWSLLLFYVVAPKGAVCFVSDVIHFMLALRGFGGPAECLWA